MADQPATMVIAPRPAYLSNGSSGQIAVMFALSMLAILPLMGLIFDGGNIYVQRRTAQNAADAAAQAGTSALMHVPAASTGAGDVTVAKAVCTYLKENVFGVTASATASSASFVGMDGLPLSPAVGIILPTGPDPLNPAKTIFICTQNSPNDIPALAAGVHVDATIGPFPTFIAGFLGKGIANGDGAGIAQATTTASSTVQGAAVTSFAADNAPFIVCGTNTRLAVWPDSLHPGLHNFPILQAGGPPYRIDPNAFGTTFLIHANFGVDTCGDSNSFTGLSDQAQNMADNIGSLDLGTTPAILTDKVGAGSNTTKNRVDGFGGCGNTIQDKCVMIIPIAISTPLPLGTNKKNCVAWGAFWITQHGASHWGQLLSSFNVGIGPESFNWTFGDRAFIQVVSMGARS